MAPAEDVAAVVAVEYRLVKRTPPPQYTGPELASAGVEPLTYALRAPIPPASAAMSVAYMLVQRKPPAVVMAPAATETDRMLRQLSPPAE